MIFYNNFESILLKLTYAQGYFYNINQIIENEPFLCYLGKDTQREILCQKVYLLHLKG